MTARDSLTTTVLAKKQKESERKKLEKYLENVRVAANKLEEVSYFRLKASFNNVKSEMHGPTCYQCQ